MDTDRALRSVHISNFISHHLTWS